MVSKTNTSAQIFLNYWLSSFYHHYYAKYKFGSFLTHFLVNEVTMEVKTAIFWESDLKNKLPISEFHQIWTPIFLSSSIYDTHFWTLFAQFGDIDIARIWAQVFLKLISLEGVSLSKIKFQKIRCPGWSAVPLWPSCEVINFEIDPMFLIKPLYLHNQKVKTKILLSWEQNEPFRRNKKHSSSFIKGFHWSQ